MKNYFKLIVIFVILTGCVFLTSTIFQTKIINEAIDRTVMYILGIITSITVSLFTSDKKKKEYLKKGSRLLKYLDKETSYFKIPEGIDEIGDRAFKDCFNLKKVDMRNIFNSMDILFVPYPIRKIGKLAFSGCKMLEELIFGRYVVICENAFEYCTSLKKVAFDEGSVVKSNAFLECINLEAVYLERCEIGELAFRNCKNLKIVGVSQVSKIENNAFLGCDNLTIVYNGYDKYIEKYCSENNITLKQNYADGPLWKEILKSDYHQAGSN